MSVDRDFLLNALLCHNYLPTQRRSKEEIPPIFSTASFTPTVATHLAKIDYRKGAYSGYDQVEYKLTRFNSVSRLLSLPHPLPHTKLCLELYEHWGNLDYIQSNPNSQIKPQQYSDGRVIIMNGYGDSVEKANRQLNEAFGKRYRVVTDIANCFPSIYSHAVPWALVTQEVAKTKKAPKYADEWFNRIDRHLRACRRDETQGVAIGPGTSSIVAETILGRIDEQLRPDFSFVRYIDDYICHCESEDRAEEFVRRLEQAAAKFKLQLNIKKTEYTRLPQPVTDSWIVEMAPHLPAGDDLSSFDAFRFLDFSVSLAKRYPSGSVMKYAASVVANGKIRFGSHAEILNYLMSLAFHEPALLPVLSKLVKSSYLTILGTKLDLFDTSTKLNAIVCENARLGRSDGMCWGLYYLGRAETLILEQTAQAVLQTGDVFAILALYWASTQHRDAVVAFCSGLDPEDLYQLDRHWILLYQLVVDEKMQNPYTDGVFNVLMQHGVTFLLPKDIPAEDPMQTAIHGEG